MKKIAFLTKENLDSFSCDDDLAVAPLLELGYQVSHLNWHEKHNWKDFVCVVVRSTWDYQDHYQEFVTVLEEIARSTLLLNDLETMKWNSHKEYLRELQDNGTKIIPTLFHEELGSKTVDELCEKLNSNKIIFKPYVGANSDNTFPISREEEFPPINLKKGDFFVQAFNQNVLDEGEFSLFFFGGEFSHAILKTPKSGDYRVQEEWGGHIQEIIPEEKMLKTAVEIVNPKLLYSRVDLVRFGDHKSDEFHLMELELIEPALYFRMNDEAASKFAQTLDRMIKHSSS